MAKKSHKIVNRLEFLIIVCSCPVSKNEIPGGRKCVHVQLLELSSITKCYCQMANLKKWHVSQKPGTGRSVNIYA